MNERISGRLGEIEAKLAAAGSSSPLSISAASRACCGDLGWSDCGAAPQHYRHPDDTGTTSARPWNSNVPARDSRNPLEDAMIEKAIGIAIVDDRGRTVRRLRKSSYFDEESMAQRNTTRWGAAGKADSRKGLAHVEAGEKRPADRSLRASFPDGDYLPLPEGSPYSQRQKVAPVLERLALALGLVDESGVVLTIASTPRNCLSPSYASTRASSASIRRNERAPYPVAAQHLAPASQEPPPGLTGTRRLSPRSPR